MMLVDQAGRWLRAHHRILVGVLPVIVLCLLAEFVLNFEDVQLWVIFATMPATLLFIVAYIPERPTRHWFGTSLLLLAFGVLSVVTAAALFRIFGADYPGRAWLVTFWVGLTFTSMVMRTLVLLVAQRRDRIGIGWALARFWRWLTRR